MKHITIYHNPNCSNSRQALAIIQNAGKKPEIIEYLKTPPSREKLVSLIEQMKIPVRQLLRSKEKIYTELKLDDPSLSDEELINAMLDHPILMNRPIVTTPLGTRLCRPPEIVLDIL